MISVIHSLWTFFPTITANGYINSYLPIPQKLNFFCKVDGPFSVPSQNSSCLIRDGLKWLIIERILILRSLILPNTVMFQKLSSEIHSFGVLGGNNPPAVLLIRLNLFIIAWPGVCTSQSLQQ
ncbi:hypothetical protein CEXT_366741 [Caerostris extrusa]|uniref:Uncharacterized protein n=1 Tax=Caerostris extrusa TaxID=172846 RepID=A0AAV4Y4X6_CAEEX|nr:hypothetical protein CEXT_366741 [Caerostris extrusa]